MLDFFDKVKEFFGDVSSFFADILTNIVSSLGDVLNFIKVICWDVPQLILNNVIPYVPYVFRVPLALLFTTIIVIFFLRLISTLVKLTVAK